MHRKPDADAIAAFFGELSRAPWLDRRRVDWPRYFFHITDVSNAVSILRDGELLSRRRDLDLGRMKKSSASEEILSKTAPEYLDCARLYFRPRTPTFWHNEGFWPRNQGTDLAAHCPMPVALLFDSTDVASQAGVRFSRGNLAAIEQATGESIAFLESLNFRQIYHDPNWDGGDSEQLRRARQAEIAVPGALSLSALQGIVARSPAELTTLRTLLVDESVAIPQSVRFIGENYRWFFGLRPYAESVSRFGNTVQFIFNPDAQVTGPFEISMTITDLNTGETATVNRFDHAVRAVQFPVSPAFAGQPVRVDVQLDGAVAYAGVLRPNAKSALIR